MCKPFNEVMVFGSNWSTMEVNCARVSDKVLTKTPSVDFVTASQPDAEFELLAGRTLPRDFLELSRSSLVLKSERHRGSMHGRVRLNEWEKNTVEPKNQTPKLLFRPGYRNEHNSSEKVRNDQLKPGLTELSKEEIASVTSKPHVEYFCGESLPTCMLAENLLLQLIGVASAYNLFLMGLQVLRYSKVCIAHPATLVQSVSSA